MQRRNLRDLTKRCRFRNNSRKGIFLKNKFYSKLYKNICKNYAFEIKLKVLTTAIFNFIQYIVRLKSNTGAFVWTRNIVLAKNRIFGKK